MKTSNISSLTIQNAMRLTISDAQSQMVEAQKEVTTGQYADVGTAIGGQASSAINLNRDSLRLQSLMDTNSLVTQRLDSSQNALDQIASAAQTLQETFVALGNNTDATTLTTAKQTATSALDTFTDMANTSSNGEYLFSGINTDVQPLTSYTALDSNGDASAAKQAFDAAFQSRFGMSPSDDAVSTISADDITDFLENTLEPMYTGSDWQDNWSKATDDTMTSRISKSEVIQSSSSANADGFRYMALASVIGVELINANFSTEARTALTSKAIEYTGKAISGINDERTQLGLSQERVTNANDSLSAQKDIIETQLNDLVGVDAYEASTRLNNLQSLVETSYTLTSRLQKLSLVDYL
ncbi:flagellar hook-associated family protein [Rhizobium paknamense]|uniref:Flagellin n=1 Tax=Rhizobium paknamense TaxID=1206817 RepID=A0ABU0IFJ5_9HYPH|nr:flagellar hook-associated family protein [Rhizobium paknamense]MDQ0457005.1 flagellar hook-associated protein 3 FlgL [Rhizobium paknamense]